MKNIIRTKYKSKTPFSPTESIILDIQNAHEYTITFACFETQFNEKKIVIAKNLADEYILELLTIIDDFKTIKPNQRLDESTWELSIFYSDNSTENYTSREHLSPYFQALISLNQNLINKALGEEIC